MKVTITNCKGNPQMISSDIENHINRTLKELDADEIGEIYMEFEVYRDGEKLDTSKDFIHTKCSKANEYEMIK